ncbi:MAG TPA: tripartite tricarboxylate transporter substrate binding protein [Burkholderiaceae bacterium]|jgi:tripartite-type tricarboxylate transporter receptor subunit TctC|nr:tripartite tricarboxylate transporter substrate binding protein [Burkholderiaceae bacterium]
MKRRTWMRGAAALLLAQSLPLDALSAPNAYPTKPVRLIVNFPPGGAADILARALASALSSALGQTFVVDNRPGANGNLGADAVAKADKDGYTLLLSSGGAMTINPFLYAKMPFDAERDLTPVAAVARVLVYLVAHPSVPANTVQEFIAYAKANPGKLAYGSAGNGSSPHLAGEMFARRAGIAVTHVPYRGAAPALNDLLAGQVQFMFDPGPGLRHAKDGKLKLLAVGSPRRAPQLPAVPTLAESGMPGFDADTIFAVYAPAGTPTAVVELLQREINKALADKRVLDAIDGIGGQAAPMTRAELIELQNRDRARFGAFIKEAGIKVE